LVASNTEDVVAHWAQLIEAVAALHAQMEFLLDHSVELAHMPMEDAEVTVRVHSTFKDVSENPARQFRFQEQAHCTEQAEAVVHTLQLQV
jgi:hypothetical protein